MEAAAQILNSQTPAVPSVPAQTSTAQEVLDNKAPPPERLAPKFEALLKRERSAVDKEKSVKSLEAQLSEREKQLLERERRIQEFESVKEKDPKKALELLGLTYQDLTNIMLNQGQLTPDIEIKKVESKLDKFLEEQRLAKAQSEEHQKQKEQQEQQQMVEECKAEVAKFVTEHSERYEFINFEDAAELVYAVIDTHYERTKNPETGLGEVLTIAQGADKVEAYLEQKYTKAPTLKKMQALLEKKVIPGAEPKQDPPKPKSTESLKPATLTNQHSATPTPPPRHGVISDDERVRRAIAYALSLRK